MFDFIHHHGNMIQVKVLTNQEASNAKIYCPPPYDFEYSMAPGQIQWSFFWFIPKQSAGQLYGSLATDTPGPLRATGVTHGRTLA